MELLYIWIKNYKNIKEQGFNFSPKWRFHYNPKTRKLDVVDRSDRVIDNFFGEHISNVTAIVGENGSGKSSLLEFILENIWLIGAEYWDAEMVVILKIKNAYYCWYNFKLKQPNYTAQFKKGNIDIKSYKFERKSQGYEGSDWYNDDEWMHADNQLGLAKIVYFSNIVDFREIKIQGAYRSNMSSNRFLKDDCGERKFDILRKKGNIENKIFNHPIAPHIFYEYKRQLNFVLFFNVIEKTLPFALPNSAKVEFKRSNRNFSIENISQEVDEKLNSIFNKIEINILNKSDSINKLKNLFNFELAKNIILLGATVYPRGTIPFLINRLDDFIKDDEIKINEFVIQFWKANQNRIGFTKVDDVINFISFFNNELDPESVTVEHRNGTIEFSLVFNSEDWPLLKEFIDKYSTIDEFWEFFLFSWRDISSGEKAFLNMFSRFFEYSKHGVGNLIILIDEGGEGFHPEWQQKLLSSLLKTLPFIFYDYPEEKIRNQIQIILTSHSPFVLSDLPKENVIFLKKGPNGECQVVDGLHDMKQTFGANIHTLLSDGFFMDGFVGDFANKKIQEVIDYLNGEKVKNMDDDKAEKIINMIGEPIVKRQLLQQFQYQKQNKEIEDLKKRIADLESKNHD